MNKLLPGLFVPVNKQVSHTLATEVHEIIAKPASETNERHFTTVDLWSIQRRKKRIAVRRGMHARI